MRLVVICAVIFFCVAASSSAQMSYGRITGRLTDSSGAVIPHANVQSVNIATNQFTNQFAA